MDGTLEVSGVRRGGTGDRAGTFTFTLAANPKHRETLHELSKTHEQWGDLLDSRLLPSNDELPFVGFVIEQWLQSSPDGPLRTGSEEAEAAIGAFVDGWSSTIVHMLALQPHTIGELERAVDGLGRAAIERNLAAMQAAGLVEARPSNSEGAFYAVTDWLRVGIAPLAAAARFEHRHAPMDLPGIVSLDVEAGFLLILPLIELPRELSGLCRLAFELPAGEKTLQAGAMARVEGGQVVSCSPRLELEADAWATGVQTAWLDAVINPAGCRLVIDGDEALARAVIDGLHQRMFGIPVQ